MTSSESKEPKGSERSSTKCGCGHSGAWHPFSNGAACTADACGCEDFEPEPRCNACGHRRGDHQGPEGLGGEQCLNCAGDEERSWRHAFQLPEEPPLTPEEEEGLDCLFCNTGASRIAMENGTFYARYDNFPASAGHVEIVPKRHVESFFGLTPAEVTDAYSLIAAVREALDAEHQPDGYTIGINEGRAAGRTIDHLHIHLIPRHHGDVPDPRGGIRRALPNGDPDRWTEEEEEAPEQCSVCGSAAVTYRNYKEQPFCASCAEGEQEPPPPQPERRPPYAVAYSADGHLYEVMLPGDAIVSAVDGALVIKHARFQIHGIVQVLPIESKEGA